MKIEKAGGGPRSVGNLWLSTVAGSMSGSGGRVPHPEGCPQLQVVGRALVHGGRYIRPLALWWLFLLALLSLSPFAVALAQVPTAVQYNCYETNYQSTSTSSGSSLLACAQAVYAKAVARGSSAAGMCVTADSKSRAGWSFTCGVGTQVRFLADTATCPANSTLSGSSCVCNSGYVPSGSSCVSQPSCPDAVGSLRVVNVTEGWARSSDANADDLVSTSGSPPSSLDDGKCLGEVSDVKSCWRSQVPAANGLYRVSCDYVIKVAGDGSGTPATDANPLTPPPACPGFVGEVNGVTVCVGTSTQPVNGTNPSPGGESPGNPAAGPKPTTGEGSGSDGAGRTPSSGNGGNAGGPGAAATPPASPTVEIEAQCGVAGKPACSVTVDESGVPTGTNAFSTPQQALDTFALERQQGIEGAGDKTSLPWIWGFNLPSGTCAPIDLSSRFGVMEWRPCEDANINNFRAAWAYLVGIFGALYIVRSMLGAVGGSGGR